jgi:hypothetical protein
MIENKLWGHRMLALHVPVIAILAASWVTACQGPNDNRPGDAARGSDTASPPAASREVEAGKPTAPITIHYDVIGDAVVGQPVSINLEVSSTLRDRPLALNYRINDSRDLTFPQAQPERVALGALGAAERVREQVTVVPQRGGRHYLNVSAEIETEGGTLLKSIAIPIQVGTRPRQQQTNGEIREAADGEAVMSMPAEESTPQ